ncbi:MotA/TolQ/ExbB proton channel family protein [Candidatus Electronema sp. TJ]|uniref:MotA/TolQ/ExbB proton channel family protein n=1 Tax=Candidatus Electronema sp. TJ TaxID=3401573 RepID=UPI003AA803F1
MQTAAILDLMDKGGWVMWPLLACSIVVTAVILERTFFWAGIVRRRNRPLRDEVLGMARQGEWTLIEQKTEDCADPVVRVLHSGILHRDFDMAKAMEDEAQQIVKRMSQFMPVMDTIITVAPMLGILGTVTGIMSAFSVLSGSGMADPKLVTGGIAEALITTVAGLVISIATVFPYNYFKSRVEHAIHFMEKYATRLEVVCRKNQAQEAMR